MNHDDHEAEYLQEMDFDTEMHVGRKPRYENEDTSPTTRRELMGWYCYGIAAEVFAVCGVGSFLPVTLEQLAREQGVLLSDKTKSCIPPPTEIAGNTIRSLAGLFSRVPKEDKGQCIVSVFGSEINSASFAMYTFSLAVFTQALVLISFSAVADHGDYRKRLLLGFGFTGATAVMLFLLVFPQIFIVGSILAVISIACLGSSFVVLNSFLPLLVANDPAVAESKKSIAMNTFPSSPEVGAATTFFDHDTETQNLSSSTGPGPIHLTIPSSPPTPSRRSFSIPMLSPSFKPRPTEKKIAPELQLSTAISSKGVALGYAAALFVQIICIIILLTVRNMTTSTSLPLRIVLFLVGAWWFIFTMPVSLWLRDRPGPPLKSIQQITSSASTNKKYLQFLALLSYMNFAWRSLFKTLTIALQLRQVIIFLIAWFLLSDAIATISGTAILFAKTELRMGTPAIAMISIVATTSGIAGAFTWPRISKRYKLQSNQTILACIAIFELVPLWGLLGYVPFVQRMGFLGLQQPWECFPLAFIHGFVMGGLSSYCRAFFGGLIPPGSEAAFYALYAITDKGSSAFGPAVVGRIVDTTGEVRMAFVFLAVLVLLPVPLIWNIDADRGKEDALRMAQRLGLAGRSGGGGIGVGGAGTWDEGEGAGLEDLVDDGEGDEGEAVGLLGGDEERE